MTVVVPNGRTSEAKPAGDSIGLSMCTFESMRLGRSTAPFASKVSFAGSEPNPWMRPSSTSTVVVLSAPVKTSSTRALRRARSWILGFGLCLASSTRIFGCSHSKANVLCKRGKRASASHRHGRGGGRGRRSNRIGFNGARSMGLPSGILLQPPEPD